MPATPAKALPDNRLVLMNRLIWILLLFACGSALPAAEPKQLFNGKDLSGWARIPRHEDAAARVRVRRADLPDGVTFGAGQNNVHTIEEFVDLEEFERGCRLALALAMQVR